MRLLVDVVRIGTVAAKMRGALGMNGTAVVTETFTVCVSGILRPKRKWEIVRSTASRQENTPIDSMYRVVDSILKLILRAHRS